MHKQNSSLHCRAVTCPRVSVSVVLSFTCLTASQKHDVTANSDDTGFELMFESNTQKHTSCQL